MHSRSNALIVTARALERRDFQVQIAASAEEAKEIVLHQIPSDSTVGLADSVTVRQIGVLAELQKRGNLVFDPFAREIASYPDLKRKTQRKTLGSDIFLTSCNALTSDGRLVYMDGTGNRIANVIFGCEKVVLVVGQNKIVRDLEEAIHHIKNVIAPYHAQTKGKKVPCASIGVCTDCRASDRMCRITAIVEWRPRRTDMKVVLGEEDLGLAWDPSWPSERISRIKSKCDPFVVKKMSNVRDQHNFSEQTK